MFTGQSIVVESAGRRRAVPHLPVDAFGRRLVGQIARTAGAADADAHRADLADPAAADVFDRLAEMAAELGALLAAGLEDDLVVPGRPHHGPRLGNRQ